jgi:PAS domain-containing protein
VSATHASEPAHPGDGYAIDRDSLLAVIEHNVDGILVIDQGGVILLANRAAEHLLGRPATSLRGTRVEEQKRRTDTVSPTCPDTGAAQMKASQSAAARPRPGSSEANYCRRSPTASSRCRTSET